MSSSFSRVSYGIPDEAEGEEVKKVLEKRGGGDVIVGSMFGRSVVEQIKSSWFW
jgi:hypothetical protein